MTTLPAVEAIYVHVPYCHTICGYCDFYSELLDRSAAPRLVATLVAELDAWRSMTRLAPRTIFVGGGTPTTLPGHELHRLLTTLRSAAPDGHSLEFTVEANPATVSDLVAETLVAAGVNRISIGAQSFNPSELRVLERIHRPEQVAQTVRNARRAGIHNLNLDLIFAVPGQSLDSWLGNLRRAIDLGPDHLSCYALTYESGTPLYDQWQSGRVQRADPELEADMYEATIDTLAASGYQHYEISNFARPGRECRHNLVYWSNGAYIGIGPSASGFVAGVRYRNVPDTAEWARRLASGGSPRCEEETRSPDQQAREAMMLGLRLIDGVDRRAFQQRYADDPTLRYQDQIRKFQSLGLLDVDQQRIRLTRPGLLLADSVVAEFL